MPTYVYECKNENKEFEIEQSITEKPIKICPECKGTITRLIVSSNFILKGKGWFKSGGY